MDETIKQYLKEHLNIEIKEESYGFNGTCLTFRLMLDKEVISSDYITLHNDEG